MNADRTKAMNLMPMTVRFIESCRNSDGGYGNTPSDPSGMEATRFAVDTLYMLEKDSKLGKTLSWVKSCSAEGGRGFSKSAYLQADLASTYYALRVLTIANERVLGRQRCARWVSMHQRADGGFSQQENDNSDIDSTYYGVQALSLLGKATPNLDGCFQFLKALQSTVGSFRPIISGIPNMEATYCAIHMISLFGKRIERVSRCKEWIRSCQSSDGGFSYIPHAQSRVSSTYWAIRTLELLDSSVSNAQHCMNWIMQCQTSEGGFQASRHGSGVPEMWPTYCAIQSLTHLVGKDGWQAKAEYAPCRNALER
jgi:prenyltransferase beta subunit